MPAEVKVVAKPLQMWWALDLKATPTKDKGIRAAYEAERMDRLNLDDEVIIWRRAMGWPQPDASQKGYEYDIEWQRGQALELWLDRELTINIHTAVIACACARSINRIEDEPVKLRGPAETLAFISERLEAGDGFVTYNGGRYDLPLALSAALRMGAQGSATRDLVHALMNGDRREQHVDLAADIKRAMVRPITLDLALRAYCGVDGKTHTGRKFFATATPDQLLDHCAEDIGNTVLLARHMYWLIQNESLRDVLALLPSA